MAVAAVAILAVACGSSGTGVTVEKGLAASAGQDIGGGAGASEAAAPALAVGGEMGAPAPVTAPLGTRSGMSGEFGAGGAMAPFAQTTAAGLTVQGFGRATADADSARVQFVVMGGYDFYGYERPVPVPGEPGIATEVVPGTEPSEDIFPERTASTLTGEDLEPLVEAIQAQGVSEDDIEVTILPGGGYYGPYGPEDTARVMVTLRDVDKVGSVVEAGSAAVNESDTLFLQNVGVTYRVDDCDALLDEARKAAVEDGRDSGQDLAEALGVSRGALLAAWEYSYDPTGYSACTQDAGYYGPYEYEGPPYNPATPAEVQIVSNVSLTFAIE